MGLIPLTRDRQALVDDADMPAISQYHWMYVRSPRSEYAVRWDPALKRNVYMHRCLMNAQKGQMVDHRNGNGLDNRRSNLRLCTNAQNQHNQHRTRGKSRYKGVAWIAYYYKWAAAIRYKGRKVSLGRFDNEEDAAIVYNVAAQLLYGEFARLNDI